MGDNRTVVNQSGTVTERNDYYPYGMQMAHNELTNSASGTDNKYKYNGKELDVMHGLNLYDYSARSQDPTLGRFTTVDPMAEKYYSISPYAYCANNPLRFIDPTGRDTLHVNPDGSAQRFPNGDVVSHPGGEDVAIQDKPLCTDDEGNPQVEIVGKRLPKKTNGIVAVEVSVSGEAGAGGNVSGGTSAIIILKGDDAGKIIGTANGDLGGGTNVGIGANVAVTLYTYEGDINNFNKHNFAGNADVTNIGGGELITGGVSQTISKDNYGGTLKGGAANIGIGVGLILLDATKMKSNTKLFRQCDTK